MAKTDDQGNWLDSRGSAVPPKYVSALDRRRDAVVERIHKIGAKLEAAMLKAKREVLSELDDYLAFLEKETGTERTGKGNLTLTNFSGNLQIEKRMDDVTDFDERLQSAKTLIDECLEEWSEGSREEIAVVVREAFNLDKKGRVNQHMILRLLRLSIKDARWNQAMDLIRESIQVLGTRQYLLLNRRGKNAETGSEQWERVNLNFSAM